MKKKPIAIGEENQHYPGDNADILLTVSEVAEYLGWSSGTVYHKLHELPGVVHLSRRCVRVWRSALIEWARERTRLLQQK
jgi:excisionase family DNA binding protein